jgi:riboflavin biosynthesis pyrimidine reductase
LERAGASLLTVEDPGVSAALRALAQHDVQSLLLEGGPEVQRAAWDEDVVDYVHLYVAPCLVGPQGVPLLDGRWLSASTLFESRTSVLGPDILIEGYVHRPH